jgi:hypothetical protein
MPISSDKIRPIAPGMSRIERDIVNEALSPIQGSVEVVTEDGQCLGKTDYRTDLEARVVVSLVGIGKGSGGEMYGLASVHTPYADHYHIDDLPKIEVVPEY